MFLLNTRGRKATYLDRGQTNSTECCEKGLILVYLETTNRSDKVRYHRINGYDLFLKDVQSGSKNRRTARGNV